MQTELQFWLWTSPRAKWAAIDIYIATHYPPALTVKTLFETGAALQADGSRVSQSTLAIFASRLAGFPLGKQRKTMRGAALNELLTNSLCLSSLECCLPAWADRPSLFPVVNWQLGFHFPKLVVKWCIVGWRSNRNGIRRATAMQSLPSCPVPRGSRPLL